MMWPSLLTVDLRVLIYAGDGRKEPKRISPALYILPRLSHSLSNRQSKLVDLMEHVLLSYGILTQPSSPSISISESPCILHFVSQAISSVRLDA